MKVTGTESRRMIAVLAVTAVWVSAVPAQRAASVERRSILDDARLRERVHRRLVDRHMESLSQAYGLTDDQRPAVSNVLEQLKQQQEEYSAGLQDEMSRLSEELRELWQKRQAGQDVDEDRLQAAGERMREIWQGMPLLNSQRVVGEVEKLLPAEQVAEGRRKWDAAREKRMREWAERYAAYRGQARLGRGPAAGSWEAFVEMFCREFQLDEAQRATAFSVLRDVQGRRDRYLAGRAEDIEAAQQLGDSRFRRERLDQLMRPLRNLYEELRTRLDRIPTSSQIETVRRQAATQPAASGAGDGSVGRAGQSGAALATRPSDMISVPAPVVRPREFRPRRANLPDSPR